jgi:hypothetical protein
LYIYLVVKMSRVEFEEDPNWPGEKEETKEPKDFVPSEPWKTIRRGPGNEGLLEINITQFQTFPHFHIVINPLLLLYPENPTINSSLIITRLT